MTFSIIFEITLRFEIYRWPIPSGKNLQPAVWLPGVYSSRRKIGFIPSQGLVVLEFIIDSAAMSITLTPDKAQSVKEACPTARDIAWVIGKIISSFPGVLLCQIPRTWQNWWLNFDCRMQLSDDSLIMPQWWVDNIEQSSSFTSHSAPTISLTTNASRVCEHKHWEFLIGSWKSFSH